MLGDHYNIITTIDCNGMILLIWGEDELSFPNLGFACVIGHA